MRRSSAWSLGLERSARSARPIGMAPAARYRNFCQAALLVIALVVLPSCPNTERQPTELRAEVTPSPTPKQPLTRTERFERAMDRCREERRSYAGDRFIPPVSHRGDNVILPVVFPDGSTAQLVYPPQLRLHRSGTHPSLSLALQKGPRRIVHERFLLITKTDINEYAGKGSVIESYQGPLGRVRVLKAKDPAEFLNPLLIHFRVGSWNVLVGDGNDGTFMGKDNRRLWAENLDGYQTKSGFIVLQPDHPLTFPQGPGEPNLYFSSCSRFIDLRLERCKDLEGTELAKKQYAEVVRGVTVHRSRNGRRFYANWCTPSGRVSVYLDDLDKRYVDLAVKGLRVREVTPPASTD